MITNCIWFDGNGEAAAKFYTSIFPNSKIVDTVHYPALDNPNIGKDQTGKVLTVTFEVDGQPFMALNGGPQFKPSEAISFVRYFDTQAELDQINAAILEAGGKQSDCGWITDPFGVSWQLVPSIMPKLMSEDGPQAQRVMQAMLKMKKLDIAALQRAADQK